MRCVVPFVRGRRGPDVSAAYIASIYLTAMRPPRQPGWRYRMSARDTDVLTHINELAHEEHELFEKEARGAATDQDRERLRDLGVQLDQCWDLLHQRRARRS